MKWPASTAQLISTAAQEQSEACTQALQMAEQQTAALRQSEQKWRSVFEFLPVGLSVVDGKDKVTDCNPALAQVLDMTLEGILAGRYAQRRNSMPT